VLFGFAVYSEAAEAAEFLETDRFVFLPIFEVVPQLTLRPTSHDLHTPISRSVGLIWRAFF